MELRQHPDGLIFITTSSDEYQATFDDFETDNGSRFPSLPDGMICRIYEPGVKHQLYTRNTAYPQPMPWAAGDAILNKYDALKVKQDAREL